MTKTEIKLSSLRKELLQCDKKLIGTLSKRFSITQKIGDLKRQQKMEVIQSNFWKKSSQKRQKWATKEKLDKAMVKAIFDQIHKYSLEQQKSKKTKK
jgi:chorismate mutase